MIKFIKNLFKKKAPKFCVDCKWYSGPLKFCKNENVGYKEFSLVKGRTLTPLFCERARQRKSMFDIDYFANCGPKAKYFEPKDL